MRVIDLTHTIRPDMPVYPGTEPPRLDEAAIYAKDGFKETALFMYSHTGTHVDPPAHIIPGGRTLDSFAPESFIGRGLVLDCRHLGEGELIGMDVLERYADELERAEFLLFCTGWDKKWGTEAYFGNYPVLSEDVLDYVVKSGVKGVGFDVIGLDPVGDVNLTYHNKLFSARDVINIENLKGLDRLIGSGFIFCCLPIKLESSDGAPARAIAILD